MASSKMLELLQHDFEEAKNASLFDKGAAMEKVAARTLVILTDLENRMQAMERKLSE